MITRPAQMLLLAAAMLFADSLTWSPIVAAGPNVVVLLADDLGWRDLSCYGSPFCETPHIDGLAARGMRFTDAYSAGSVCSPTRASLMTGKYPPRTGVTDYIPGLQSKGEQMPTPRTAMQLSLEEYTLGEMFQQNGYQTFYAGKWHLGGPGFEPPDQGFDFYVGDEQLGRHQRDWQVGQRLTEAFEQFVDHQRDKQKPFLAVLAFHEPHTPILEYPQHIDRFRKKQAQLPAANPPRPEHDGLTRDRQDDADYGSEVAGLDEWVGNVLSTLNQAQLTEETMVVFFSDNGGLSTKAQPGPTNNDPLRAGKGWLYEGGVRVPLIVCAPGRIAAGSVSEQVVMSFDLVPTLLDLAGLPLYPQQHVDGRSFADILLGESRSWPHRAVYWHYPHYHGSTWAPGAAMRDGQWKLVQLDHFGAAELYDLSSDLSESHNLASQEPQRVQRMQQQLAAWQQEVGAKYATPRNLQHDLVAWCIVPFDASKRTPEQRAQMLSELGFSKLAYDWREEHVASWDAEVDALKKHGIQLAAFWGASSLNPTQDARMQRIVQFLERRKLATQIWFDLPDGELAKIEDETARIQRAAQAVRELAEQIRPLGCQVGLYNHGGWVGRPQTMLHIMRALDDLDNVGLVYNFHHAHEDLAAFPQALHDMKPYLLCLNLNGMSLNQEKIITLGQGELDRQWLSWIRQAQYRGPIGILDHRNELDAKQSLQLNLAGLQGLLDAN